MTELAKGIVAFAGVIGNAMPVFLDAFVKLITTLLTAIDVLFPRIMSTLWMLLVGLVSLVVRAVPLLVDAGMKLIIGILTGIGKNMGKLLDAATKVITEFLDGLARNLPKIIDSGINLVVKFVQGLADGVKKLSKEMTDAGLDLAQAIIEGMINGLWDGVQRVINAAFDVGKRVIDSIAGALDSHSPSKETHKLGTYASWGLANGISALSGKVEKAARGVGETAVDTLKQSISDIHDNVGGNIDMTPTIRPVLDLSAIKKDSSLIAGMIKTPKLNIEGTYAMASHVAKSSRENEKATVISGDTPPPPAAGGGNVIFNQYNNSPRALSRVELYRQTNNQLSVAKGALTANAK
jgi:phage-related protein